MLSELRQELKEYVRQVVANVIQFTYVTVATATGHGDATEGYNTVSGEPSSQYQTRRMQHFGFRSVPPAGTAAIRLHSNAGPSNAATVAEENPNYGPTNLASGETCIFCKASGASVKLNKDGKITLNAATGQDITADGTHINLNSGSVGVARLNDTVTINGAVLEALLDARYAQVVSPISIPNFNALISSASSTVKAG